MEQQDVFSASRTNSIVSVEVHSLDGLDLVEMDGEVTVHVIAKSTPLQWHLAREKPRLPIQLVEGSCVRFALPFLVVGKIGLGSAIGIRVVILDAFSRVVEKTVLLRARLFGISEEEPCATKQHQ